MIYFEIYLIIGVIHFLSTIVPFINAMNDHDVSNDETFAILFVLFKIILFWPVVLYHIIFMKDDHA